VAAQVKAGVVWINGTNLFDANAPFGGMRESGFGREGAREGMLAYLARAPIAGKVAEAPPVPAATPARAAQADSIDRTPKLYIGGKQARPDSGNSFSVTGRDATVLGQAPLGSRKDIRNAVEAAHKAAGWAAMSGHGRAQVLYFLGENLAMRRDEFTELLGSAGAAEPGAELEQALRRCFRYAAMADKRDGRVHSTLGAHVTLVMQEPFGVMGLVCPEEAPLLAFLSMVLPAISMGNRVVAVPSQSMPLPALQLVQLFETSDLPPGVVNIVSGPRSALAQTLAEHDDVAALWHFGPHADCAMAERAAAGNLKPVWAEHLWRDWTGAQGQSSEFLDRATQFKTIWVPYGA
jgi:aldehyde dehydrogenase (NAD+)